MTDSADTMAQDERAPVPQPQRSPGWFRPVLVLAPARSNSSVVSSMIGMHPELYGFPELSLWRGSTIRDLITDRPNSRGLKARARTAGLARAIAQLKFGDQEFGSVRRARQWLEERQDWDVACVFDTLQEWARPLTALEKSPENSNRRDYLERLDRAYPRARYLHVTRHPIASVNSMFNAWKSADLWDVPDDLAHLHLLGTWLFHHGRIAAFVEALPPDRWHRVRSEDVLNRPEEVLPRICAWLGIDTGDKAIEAMLHPENSPYARLGPENALGGNDPGFLRNPARRVVDDDLPIAVPEEWIVDPWTVVAVIALARRLGYDNPGG